MTGASPAALLRQRLCAALALITSVVCAAMAAAAAVERATTSMDRWLVTAVAVALVLGAHILPALARKSWWARVIFAGCVAATLYHHAHYFHGVQERSGVQRAAAVTMTGHAKALQDELGTLSVRAVPVVAADLAQAGAKAAQAGAVLARCTAKGERCTGAQASAQAADARVQALQDERTASLRASTIRAALAEAAQAQDQQRTALAADPVDTQLAALLGVRVDAISLVFALLQSLLLELVAAYLWTLALPGAPTPAPTPALTPTTVPVAPVAPMQAVLLSTAPPRPERTRLSTALHPLLLHLRRCWPQHCTKSPPPQTQPQT